LSPESLDVLLLSLELLLPVSDEEPEVLSSDEEDDDDEVEWEDRDLCLEGVCSFLGGSTVLF